MFVKDTVKLREREPRLSVSRQSCSGAMLGLLAMVIDWFCCASLGSKLASPPFGIIFCLGLAEGIVLCWLGHDRDAPNEHKILADVPFVKLCVSCQACLIQKMQMGRMPTEGFPPMATAVPATIPALPPLPDKPPPMPAAVKPITPDSPDIRPTVAPEFQKRISDMVERICYTAKFASLCNACP
ncbi:hypothetical protein WJX77_009693 [Trebouxia sp. C0004]